LLNFIWKIYDLLHINFIHISLKFHANANALHSYSSHTGSRSDRFFKAIHHHHQTNKLLCKPTFFISSFYTLFGQCTDLLLIIMHHHTTIIRGCSRRNKKLFRLYFMSSHPLSLPCIFFSFDIYLSTGNQIVIIILNRSTRDFRREKKSTTFHDHDT